MKALHAAQDKGRTMAEVASSWAIRSDMVATGIRIALSEIGEEEDDESQDSLPQLLRYRELLVILKPRDFGSCSFSSTVLSSFLSFSH
jgi:hypothetical protein